MEKKILLKIQALQKQAREGGKLLKPYTRHRSSLHSIIKTKEQADRFIKQLLST